MCKFMVSRKLGHMASSQSEECRKEEFGIMQCRGTLYLLSIFPVSFEDVQVQQCWVKECQGLLLCSIIKPYNPLLPTQLSFPHRSTPRYFLCPASLTLEISSVLVSLPLFDKKKSNFMAGQITGN